MTAKTRALLLPWVVCVALCGVLATGCGAADPLPANDAVLVESEPPPAISATPDAEKSEDGVEGLENPKGTGNRVGQRQESTPQAVLRSSSKPAAKPLPLPTRQNELITLEFLSADGKPFSAPLSALPPPHFFTDIAWHAVFTASNAQQETDDAGADSTRSALSAFFSRHVLVLSPGNGALKKASEWMSKFVGDSESVSFLASKNAPENATRKSLESLRVESQKRAIVETPPPIASHDELERELLWSFEDLFALWREAAFATPDSSNLFLPVGHKEGNTPGDPVFDAFFGAAPEFLPSGRLVPFQVERLAETAVGAFLRDGVLYVTIRNETPDCAAFDILLPATLEAKHIVLLSLSATASSQERVVAYDPSSDCIPPADFLLVRASSAL